MASPKPRNAIFLKGTLVADPTDADLETDPFGNGTQLGLTRDAVLRTNLKHRFARAFELGNRIVEVIAGEETVIFTAVMREFDDDMMQRIFLNTVVGSISQARKIQFGANRTLGNKRSGDAIKLLLSPNDTVNGRALIIYKAVPLVDENGEFAFQLKNGLGTAISFYGIPSDSDSNLIGELGRMRDIVL